MTWIANALIVVGMILVGGRRRSAFLFSAAGEVLWQSWARTQFQEGELYYIRVGTRTYEYQPHWKFVEFALFEWPSGRFVDQQNLVTNLLVEDNQQERE